MSEKDDGGPAYPAKAEGYVSSGPHGEAIAQYRETSGMSLRDWFAGQALAGLLAKYFLNKPEDQKTTTQMAYQLADAMLTERAKP